MAQGCNTLTVTHHNKIGAYARISTWTPHVCRRTDNRCCCIDLDGWHLWMNSEPKFIRFHARSLALSLSLFDDGVCSLSGTTRHSVHFEGAPRKARRAQRCVATPENIGLLDGWEWQAHAENTGWLTLCVVNIAGASCVCVCGGDGGCVWKRERFGGKRAHGHMPNVLETEHMSWLFFRVRCGGVAHAAKGTSPQQYNAHCRVPWGVRIEWIWACHGYVTGRSWIRRKK